METERTETFEVPVSEPNERLDAYLVQRYPVASRGTIQRLIKDGDIRVDGKQVKPNHHPKAGEQITVSWPAPRSAEAQPEDIPLDILHEDEDLIVLNKPPGLVVHPASGNEEGTLVNALLHHCQGQLSGIGGVARPGIVHRLDKDTSGCLVVAKNDPTHLELSRQFAERETHKVYRALVCGHPPQSQGSIRAAIARHPDHRKRMAVQDGHSAREAWTDYKVLEAFPEATDMEVLLHTGRTHQIRVHFQHIGTPILGDDLYGKRKNQILGQKISYKAPRQMLHSWKLSFQHPKTGEKVHFEAPIPKDFHKARSILQSRGL